MIFLSYKVRENSKVHAGSSQPEPLRAAKSGVPGELGCIGGPLLQLKQCFVIKLPPATLLSPVASNRPIQHPTNKGKVFTLIRPLNQPVQRQSAALNLRDFNPKQGRMHLTFTLHQHGCGFLPPEASAQPQEIQTSLNKNSFPKPHPALLAVSI